MKKILIVAALALGFAVAASAQPKAIGIRGSYGVEVNYHHYLVGINFLEIGVGMPGFNDANIAAVYNFSIVEFGDGFNFYAGPGVGLEFGKQWFGIGVAGQVGLEYNFKFPLNLSIDLRPQLGFASAAGVSAFGFWGWYPNLGIRYQF